MATSKAWPRLRGWIDEGKAVVALFANGVQVEVTDSGALPRQAFAARTFGANIDQRGQRLGKEQRDALAHQYGRVALLSFLSGQPARFVRRSHGEVEAILPEPGQ
jgi:hypothetical protein